MTPHPIIPQTPQQAAQRDDLHQRRNPDARLPLTAAQELERLRAAIRAHREAVKCLPAIDLHCVADEALWAHLDPPA